MNRVSAPFGRAFRFMANVGCQIMVAAGVLVLLGTGAVVAILTDKNLAVAVATSGTFVGTALVTLFLPKLIGAGKAEEVRRELAASAQSQRLEEAENQRRQAEHKALEAEREIARLEAMRINIEAISPVVRLGLLEVETNITDFQHRPISRQEHPTWWRNGHQHSYLGVIQIPIKAQLGIDLQKVSVSALGDRLLLSGLEMTTVTDTGEGAKWLLDEVRTEFLRGDRIVKFKGDPHDARAKAYSREHELQVRARIQAGQDFKVFEAGLIRTAQQMLRVLLAPLGKEIWFESARPAGAQELLAFLQEHNQKLALRMAALKQPSTDRSVNE